MSNAVVNTRKNRRLFLRKLFFNNECKERFISTGGFILVNRKNETTGDWNVAVFSPDIFKHNYSKAISKGIKLEKFKVVADD